VVVFGRTVFVAGVFVIGDNLLIRTLLREILGEAGYEVLGDVRHGPSAVSRVFELRPELVIVDVVLVRDAAFSVLRHLLMIDAGLAVVLCAAVLERRNAIVALRLGARGFIVKPFDRQAVLDSVSDALGDAGGQGSGVARDAARRGSVRGGVQEHREFVRLVVALPVVLRGEGVRCSAYTTDVSGGGMLLAEGPLPLGAVLDFRLDLGSGQRPVRGRARVVRVTDAGRPALQFESVGIADHERLIEYITRHERAAPFTGQHTS
jgi:two-component system chemotaxis response regulator CheY